VFYFGIDKLRRKQKMKRNLNLFLIIFAAMAFAISGFAQTTKKPTREVVKIDKPSLDVTTGEKKETVISKRIERGSRELQRVYADKIFLNACEVLLMDGEMFLEETAQLLTDGDSFSVTFNVVNETTRTAGQYKQLVYSFDGKEASVYFNEKNDKPSNAKMGGGGGIKIKLPDWWPGSGSGGGVTFGGGSGGTSGNGWGEWQGVSIDNCHANLVCPMIHMGKMREEERYFSGNKLIKQTRWILIKCGCN
jgi:hypothetical protein